MTYLFDFDGTLVDSMPAFTKVMLKILDENNIKYSSDIIKTITPLGYYGTSEYFISLGVKNSPEGLVDVMKEYAQKYYENSIPLKVGVFDTLKKLKENGHSLNVLTASPHSALDVCLKRCGVYDLFDNVWSCDDFNTTKSNPEIYKMAARKLGCDVDCVTFVDDNVHAVKTAKTAGMIAYGIFDESSADFVENMKEVSDKYLYNFAELLK